MTVGIRPESPQDFATVRLIHERAFGQPGEANLVEALRAEAKPQISLVAEHDGRVAGHIVFSPVTLDPVRSGLTGMGLAPVAVLPEFQRRGIGGQLVRAGLDECRRLGRDYVVVLGHPDYYPKFGFFPARNFGLRSEYPAAEDAFMALELRPGALAGIEGLVAYHVAFRTLSRTL